MRHKRARLGGARQGSVFVIGEEQILDEIEPGLDAPAPSAAATAHYQRDELVAVSAPKWRMRPTLRERSQEVSEIPASLGAESSEVREEIEALRASQAHELEEARAAIEESKGEIEQNLQAAHEQKLNEVRQELDALEARQAAAEDELREAAQKLSGEAAAVTEEARAGAAEQKAAIEVRFRESENALKAHVERTAAEWAADVMRECQGWLSSPPDHATSVAAFEERVEAAERRLVEAVVQAKAGAGASKADPETADFDRASSDEETAKTTKGSHRWPVRTGALAVCALVVAALVGQGPGRNAAETSTPAQTEIANAPSAEPEGRGPADPRTGARTEKRAKARTPQGRRSSDEGGPEAQPAPSAASGPPVVSSLEPASPGGAPVIPTAPPLGPPSSEPTAASQSEVQQEFGP